MHSQYQLPKVSTLLGLVLSRVSDRFRLVFFSENESLGLASKSSVLFTSLVYTNIIETNNNNNNNINNNNIYF